jgi:hypothetical protein
MHYTVLHSNTMRVLPLHDTTTHKQMMCSALEGSAAAVTLLLSQQQQQQQQQQQSVSRVAGTNTTNTTSNCNNVTLCADQDEEDALELLIKSLEVFCSHFLRIFTAFFSDLFTHVCETFARMMRNAPVHNCSYMLRRYLHKNARMYAQAAILLL